MDRFPEPFAAPKRREPAADLPECRNCGKPSETLTWLPGWDFNGCPECAAQCRIMEAAEDANGEPRCPVQYGALVRANSAAELLDVLKAHRGAECVHCASTRDTVLSERLVLALPAAVCCDRAVA
jgi:hypothetical protein